MLTDLAALTPPLLVAVAFLIAAGAFIRHEMRRAKNPTDSADDADSAVDSSDPSDGNDDDHGSARRPFTQRQEDPDDEPDE